MNLSPQTTGESSDAALQPRPPTRNLSDRQLLMLAASASPPVAEQLKNTSFGPPPMWKEDTPTSIEELAAMLEVTAKALPKESNEELQTEVSQRLATGSSSPPAARASSSMAFAAPVARPAHPMMLGRPRQRRERRANVRLGSQSPTELESAFESALKSAWRWLTHAPQPMPSPKERGASRRRSAEDGRMQRTAAPSHVEEERPPALLKRTPTW